MADSTTWIDTIAEAQADKEVTANGAIDAASPSMTFARRQSTTTMLNWGYYGGRVAGTLIANGTLTLTASTVNYIVVHRTTFAVSVSTSGVNWCTPETYARLYRLVVGDASVTSYEDHRCAKWGIWSARSAVEPESIELVVPLGAIGDALTTGTSKAYRRAPCDFLLTDARAAVATASSSGAPAFDINNSGTSIFNTTLTIDANEKTSVTAATAFALAEFGDSFANDDEITFDCDTAGTGTAGVIWTLKGIRNVRDRYRDFVRSQLAFDGSDASTTMTDTYSGRTWTVSGGAQIDTAQSMFGGSSLLCDGSGDYIYSDNSTDWNLAASDFTISFWVRFSVNTGTQYLFYVGTGTTQRSFLYLESTTLRWATADGAAAVDRITSSALSATTWYHVLLSRQGTSTRLFIDGAQAGSTSTSTVLYSGTSAAYIGVNGASFAGTYFNGWMDDFSYDAGVARRVAAFTKPARARPTA